MPKRTMPKKTQAERSSEYRARQKAKTAQEIRELRAENDKLPELLAENDGLRHLLRDYIDHTHELRDDLRALRDYRRADRKYISELEDELDKLSPPPTDSSSIEPDKPKHGYDAARSVKRIFELVDRASKRFN